MEQSSSTKQLKQVLGFGDLMGAAVGQILPLLHHCHTAGVSGRFCDCCMPVCASGFYQRDRALKRRKLFDGCHAGRPKDGGCI